MNAIMQKYYDNFDNLDTPAKCVLSYYRKHTQAPLFISKKVTSYGMVNGFYRFIYEEVPIPDSPHQSAPVSKWVDWVSNVLEERSSLYKSGRQQCRPGARRSAGDLWRCLLVYLPELDIFSVMRAIYELDGNLNRSYCDVVRKRVFYPDPEGYGDAYDDEYVDEFHTVFEDWENIGNELK